jgi:hypothetical protein
VRSLKRTRSNRPRAEYKNRHKIAEAMNGTIVAVVLSALRLRGGAAIG